VLTKALILTDFLKSRAVQWHFITFITYSSPTKQARKKERKEFFTADSLGNILGMI